MNCTEKHSGPPQGDQLYLIPACGGPTAAGGARQSHGLPGSQAPAQTSHPRFKQKVPSRFSSCSVISEEVPRIVPTLLPSGVPQEAAWRLAGTSLPQRGEDQGLQEEAPQSHWTHQHQVWVVPSPLLREEMLLSVLSSNLMEKAPK